MKKVSIIIPVKEINEYIREAIPHYYEMDYEDYEILIFTDYKTKETFEHARIIPSGEVGPAEKRDLALKYATGEIFAFIDDDAYPSKNWLKNAVRIFNNKEIGAVGGPAVTPDTDDILQKASGCVFESKMCSGEYTYRYYPEIERDVDDLPSVNLLVKRDVFERVGGYDSNFYPGEDTKLCLDIIEKTCKKIVYAPDVLVYHHRRKLFKPHLKQITNYAKHRGYFAKTLPKTSCKFSYFVPTLFVLGLLIGPAICMCFPLLWYVYISIIVLYLLLVGISIKRANSIQLWILTMTGIFLTHVGYGLFFVRGLGSRKLLR